MKKLSQLPQYCYLEHECKIVTKKSVLKLIAEGKPVSEVKTVTDEYIQSILDQMSDQRDETEKSEYLSAPNHGDVVEIDMTKEEAEKEITYYVFY